MQLRAEEISNIIKQQIASYEKAVDVVETGTVLTVGDGIARLYGLESAMAGELLEFPGGVYDVVPGYGDLHIVVPELQVELSPAEDARDLAPFGGGAVRAVRFACPLGAVRDGYLAPSWDGDPELPSDQGVSLFHYLVTAFLQCRSFLVNLVGLPVQVVRVP